jgi:putative peptidoglycan lipid II flippase
VSGRGAYLVAAGIFLSRISGLVRQRILAHFLGLSDSADALAAGIRIPNLLQNLFGEGALSASFIPSYSRLLEEGRDEDARRLAGGVLSLLGVVVALIVLVGVLSAPWLVAGLAPGFDGGQRELTITLVRIMFPGVGLLVLSAWCLGVLNSHRRFLVSYSAPVAWNTAIILLAVLAPNTPTDVVIWAAWGSVVGSVLQVLVQWPSVRQVAGSIRPLPWRNAPELSTVVRTFLPNVISRGATQISAFIDLALATMVPGNAVAAITNAQVLYTLPVSLFGMAVSAAELPEMSRQRGDPAAVAAALRIRLDAATQRLAFYIVPSAMAFLSIGGVLAAAVYQTGQFTAADSRYVWAILAGSAIGLLAATLGRLYSSAFYALRDTLTPLRVGLVRITLTAALGAFGALVAPRMLGLEPRWGAVGITMAAGVAGWVEFSLLRRALIARLGKFSLPLTELAKLWVASVAAAAGSIGVQQLVGGFAPIPKALVVVPVFGMVYLMVTWWLDLPEAAVLAGRLRRRS